MTFITETSAYFVPDQCLFGAYPTQHQISQLENWGVNIIVNLTNDYERKIKPYTTNANVIHFPIPDHGVPEYTHQFCSLVVDLTKAIKNNKKIYIHCKGGHGRSGILVAAILCYLQGIKPELSFLKTTEYHATRPVHSSKPRKNDFWKNKGSPQTAQQRNFVRTIFQPYNIPKDSPFSKRGEWLSGLYDSFLRKTNLGPITGSNGKDLELYRETLIINDH
jgi:hypothetical protein